MSSSDRGCDACGRPMMTAAAGERCGACAVSVCYRCLEGTRHCPSCQRPFERTRSAFPTLRSGRHARAQRPRSTPRAAATPRGPQVALVIAVLVSSLVAIVRLARPERPMPTGILVDPPRGLLEGRPLGDDSAYALSLALDARAPSVVRPALAEASCEEDVAWLASRATLIRQLYARPHQDARSLEDRLALLEIEVLPLAREGVGPMTRRLRAHDLHIGPTRGHRVTLVIDSFEDPHVDGTLARGGRLTGRLLVWSDARRRMVCGAELDVRGDEHAARQHDDDLIGHARARLVIDAVAAGAVALRAVAD